MLDAVIRIYELLGVGNPKILGLRYKSAARWALRQFAKWALPTYFYITKNNPNHCLKATNKRQLIVSLTSFPARINYVWQAIESILRQTYKPDKLILWLSKDQFPNKYMDLPHKLIKQQARGLEIIFVDNDIFSHKKYFYVFRDFPESSVITLDDDIYYKCTLIEELYKAHMEYPYCVISNYGLEIKYNTDGLALHYSEWKFLYKDIGYSKNYFFGSGGGTFFPPHILNSDVTNINLALDVCPKADDIWLNAMCQLNDVTIIKINTYCPLFEISIPKNQKLCFTNIGNAENDLQIEKLRQKYPNANLFYKKV